MNLILIYLTNNATAYGGAQPLRQTVLFVFIPDGNGMRYKKIVGSAKTDYYYNGTQLLMEDRGGGADRIYYIYGASGISGMILQEGYAQYTYYFDKNTLGDIIAIRNSNGDVVARYTYDAWGNHKVLKASGTTDTNQSSIGNINPFRYRGYYYDTETGFYYLQTRYYDPTICRFINADNYELVMLLGRDTVGGFNVYSYCFNNPILFIDDGGYWPKPFTYRGWRIRFDPPRAGSGQQYHVHVDGYGKSYAQNIDGTSHDGLTGVPDKGVRDAIEKATKGKWSWNVNKMILGDLPRWQEGFSVPSLPYHQETFSVESLPQYQEQFSTGGLSSWQEGFSMSSNQKNNVLIYVVGGVAVVVVFAAAVYFTGGYALILLA